MNLSSLSHALLALVAQTVIALITGNWMLGAYFGAAFYLGREVAQHEADRLKYFGYRATFGSDEGMPWYEGFKVFDWSLDGKFDLLVPVAAVVLLAYLKGV